ncbi:MAG: glucose-6-phosphate isomerase [Pseudomonadota bacterium]
MSLDDAWSGLEAAHRNLDGVHLRTLFGQDPVRAETFSFTCGALVADLSKEWIDGDALEALLTLATAAGVERRRDAMMAGEPINQTEGRAVLHPALRGGTRADVAVSGVPVMPDVDAVLTRFLDYAEAVRSGAQAGTAGRFTDVVNIGIGGSDLGPAMAVAALAPFHDGPRVHFVSNVDGAHIGDTLRALDPATTLVIVASKTFTTMETMTNARSARAWLVKGVGEQNVGRHLAAVSTNLDETGAFGIDPARVFGFWDWVGGRYSVWSAIGLPVAIAIGARAFREFLAGAAAMDTHFVEAPLPENLPVLLALVGIWRRNVMKCPTVAVLPYDQRLSRFAAYLQQLDMESNGKRVALDGRTLDRASGPVVFGEPGTNSQHSFFQLLHQGTEATPADFLIAARCRDGVAGHHGTLFASALAQTKALAFGKTEDEVRAEMASAGKSAAEIDALAPHRTFPGNRPTTTLFYPELDPEMLGMLIALYEHKVFVQGVIWGLNSFDQWGVELGKALTNTLLPVLDGGALDQLDSSTARMIERYRAAQQ